jgi:hypothetical protein
MQCIVDDALLAEAREVLGTATAQETIEAGLREAIRSRRLEELRAALGNTDVGMTREELLRQREREAALHLPASDAT